MASATAPGRGRLPMRVVALAYLALLVLVPLVVVTQHTISAGGHAFWTAISGHSAVVAYRLTAEASLIAVALNVVFGVGVALLLTRYRFPGRRALGVLVDLPISVSPVVVGLALVLVYGPESHWLGKDLVGAGFHVIYSLPGITLATAFVSLPLVLREVVPVLAEEGTEQEQAAQVLGAGPWQRFLRITLPTIRPALLYGIVLSLARAIGEFGAVNVVSGNVSGTGQTQTVPLLIDQRITNQEPGSYQLAFILIVVTVAAIVIVNLRRDRKARPAPLAQPASPSQPTPLAPASPTSAVSLEKKVPQ